MRLYFPWQLFSSQKKNNNSVSENASFSGRVGSHACYLQNVANVHTADSWQLSALVRCGKPSQGCQVPIYFFSADKPTLKAIQLEMPVALHPDMQTSHRKCQCLHSLCFSPQFLDFKNNFSYVVLDFLKKKKSHP